MPDTNALLERADLLLEHQRHEEAEKNIKQVLQLEPENDYALSMLARSYLNSKRFDEGIEVIQKAIAIDPENSFYFYLLGFGYYQKNVFYAAIHNLNKAIELNPYAAEYYGMLAHSLIEEKRFEEALEKSNEGLELEAENLTCLNARSIALNKLKRIEEAVSTMENALTQHPDNEITHVTVGWNFLEKGRHKEANKHFLEALRINPNLEAAKVGMKESLKSKVLLYKRMLQYSFWVNNEGKNFHKVLPIALFILFRILIAVSRTNESTSGFTWIIGGIYLFIVVVSWTIESIANFVLLFHPFGKHALNQTEKNTAVSVVFALVSGLLVLSVSWLTNFADDTVYDNGLPAVGLVLLSLALPLGRMEYPLAIKNKNWRELFGIGIILFGVLYLTLFLIDPSMVQSMIIVYGIAFILFTWLGSRS